MRFHWYVEDACVFKIQLKLIQVKLETIQGKPEINVEVGSDPGLENIFLNFQRLLKGRRQPI